MDATVGFSASNESIPNLKRKANDGCGIDYEGALKIGKSDIFLVMTKGSMTLWSMDIRDRFNVSNRSIHT